MKSFREYIVSFRKLEQIEWDFLKMDSWKISSTKLCLGLKKNQVSFLLCHAPEFLQSFESLEKLWIFTSCRMLSNSQREVIAHGFTTESWCSSRRSWKLLLGYQSKTGDVAQWLVHRNSQIEARRPRVRAPWRGGVKNSFSFPPSQLLCRLVCAWPPFVCMACTKLFACVKDPISICYNRVQ